MIELEFYVESNGNLDMRNKTNYQKMHGVAGRLFGDNCYGVSKTEYIHTPIVYDKNKRIETFFFRTESDERIIALKQELKKSTVLFDSDGIKSVVTGVRQNYNDLTKEMYYTVTPVVLSKKFKDKIIPKEKYGEISEWLMTKVNEMLDDCDYKEERNIRIEVLKVAHRQSIKYKTNDTICYCMSLKIVGDERIKELILLHGLGRKCALGFGFIR